MIKFFAVIFALFFTRQATSVCIGYQGACTQATAATCCFYPLVGCLPDTRSGTSCISYFDAVNLSPSITGLNPFTPLLQNFENASSMFLMAFNPTNPLINPITNPLVLLG